NIPDKPFGLVADVSGHRNALAQDRLSPQRWPGSLRPLRETRIHLAVGVEETDRLAPSCQQCLEQGDSSVACQLRYGPPRLIGGRYQPAGGTDSLLSVPEPRLVRLHHRREPQVL